MYLLIQLLVIIRAFISQQHDPIPQSPSSYTFAVVPITKHIDTEKPLYSAQIMATDLAYMEYSYSNLLIDIDAPFTWHDCVPEWKSYPIANDEFQCKDIQTTYSSKNSSCHRTTANLVSPSWGYGLCHVNVVNPVTGSCDDTVLNYDFFTVNTSNNKNYLTGVYSATPIGACASSESFQSFPKNVTGVMALSSSPYSLPVSVYDPLKKVIALCLPSSSSAPGVLFSGIGPYYLLPNLTVDIRSLLSYTPLLKHPNSFGYFINANAIVIKNLRIDIPVNATTKLTTIEPHTTLRTDIYTQVVKSFAMATKQIPKAKPIAPFGLCFSTSTNGTKVRITVPDIDLSLEGGNKWTLSTPNSIKQMTKDVACLAFVDGGATSEPAITIGTFQFEDNFVVFDLENSRFGFSSSLLSKGTSCANLNFTLA